MSHLGTDAMHLVRSVWQWLQWQRQNSLAKVSTHAFCEFRMVTHLGEHCHGSCMHISNYLPMTVHATIEDTLLGLTGFIDIMKILQCSSAMEPTHLTEIACVADMLSTSIGCADECGSNSETWGIRAAWNLSCIFFTYCRVIASRGKGFRYIFNLTTSMTSCHQNPIVTRGRIDMDISSSLPYPPTTPFFRIWLRKETRLKHM